MEPRSIRVLACLVGAVVFTAACGGNGDTASESEATTVDAGESGDDQVADNDADEVVTADQADGTGGDDPDEGEGGDLTCDDIFTMSEMEEWFGEPIELSVDIVDAVGQLACTWETIEDPNDLEDLAVSLMLAQVFRGDPVPAASFIDPEIFEEVTMIDGVGDLAFVEEQGGRSYYVLDEPVAGSLSYTEINMGDADANPLHSVAEQDELFRLFHQRIAG